MGSAGRRLDLELPIDPRLALQSKGKKRAGRLGEVTPARFGWSSWQRTHRYHPWGTTAIADHERAGIALVPTRSKDLDR